MRWYLLVDSAEREMQSRPVMEPVVKVQGHSVMLFVTRIPGELR
jgi:hypothetical protein